MTEPDSLAQDEARRLAAVRRYDILDTPPDGSLDRITSIELRRFNVPISIISIVDEDRIGLKSHHGTSVGEVEREPGLCASAIMSPGPYAVEDAKRDPRSLAIPSSLVGQGSGSTPPRWSWLAATASGRRASSTWSREPLTRRSLTSGQTLRP